MYAGYQSTTSGSSRNFYQPAKEQTDGPHSNLSRGGDWTQVMRVFSADDLACQSSDIERLRLFCEIKEAGTFPTSDFTLHINEGDDSWSYQISLEGVGSYKSEALVIGAGDVCSYFQKELLLTNVLQWMKENYSRTSESDLIALKQLAKEVPFSCLSSASSVVKTFEAMSKIISTPGQEAFIKLNGLDYEIGLNDSILHKGLIPPASSNNGLTPRVQMTMAAMKVALIPILRSYSEFKLWDDCDQHIDDFKLDLSRSINLGINSFDVRLKAALAEKGIAPPVDGDFSLRALQAYEQVTRVTQEVTKEVFTSKLKPMTTDIYNGDCVMAMTSNEKVALHNQMHETRVGEFTLGGLINVPKPTDEQLALAGVTGNFQ